MPLLQNYFSILKRMLYVACLVAIPLGSSALFADSIGINFASLNDNNPGATVTGSAGVISQSNWNNYNTNEDQPTGTISTLSDNNGVTITGVDVSWTAPNAWRQDQRNDDGGNGSLMWGYLDSSPTPEGPSVTITGVPYSNYSVIIYSGPDGNRGGEFTIDGQTSTTVGSATSFIDSGGAFRAGIDYTVITGLTSSTLALTTTGRDAVSGLQIIEGGFAIPVVTVNRETGNISVVLAAGALPVTATGYTLASANDSFDSGNWNKFAGTTSWVEASATAGDLSEVTFDTSKAVTLATNTTTDLGNVWTKSPYETNDITFEYLGTDGNINAIPVEFTGNGGNAYALGDFNFDGNIDAADWSFIQVGNGTDLTGMSIAQAYGKGDMNKDGVNNLSDLLQFKTAYLAANGAGSFAAMLESTNTAVPEPSTVVLLLMGAVFMFVQRSKKPSLLFAVALLSSLSLTSASQAASVGINFQDERDLPNTEVTGTTGVILQGNWNNFATVDGSSTDVVDENGTDTAIEINWDSNNTWAVTQAENNSLMRGYLDNTPATDIVVTISGVSLAKYAVIVYADGDNGGNTRTGEYTLAPAGGGTPIVQEAVDEGTVNNEFAANQTFVQGRNFTMFTGITASEFTLTAHSVAANPRAPINAIQLVELPEIKVLVDRGTGEITLHNEHATNDLDLEYYEILSAAGDLDKTSWSSLDDQNHNQGTNPVGWSELGAPDGNRLAEFNLDGTSTVAGDGTLSLGNAYSGSTEDLSFKFRVNGFLLDGVVEYTGTGGTIPGDTDGDGDVDATDLAAVGLNWDPSGADAPHPLLHGNFDGDTDVDASDLAAVGLNWNPAGGGSSLSTAAVPEPSSLILLAIGFVCLGFRKKM